MARAPLSRRRRRRPQRVLGGRWPLSGRVQLRARSPPLSWRGPTPAVRRPQLFKMAVAAVTAQRDLRLTQTGQGRLYPKNPTKALKEAAQQPRSVTAVGGSRVFPRRATAAAGEGERCRGDANRCERDGGFVGHELPRAPRAPPRRFAAVERGGYGVFPECFLAAAGHGERGRGGTDLRAARSLDYRVVSLGDSGGSAFSQALRSGAGRFSGAPALGAAKGGEGDQELHPRRGAVHGEGGGPALDTHAEHGDPIQEIGSHQDAPVHTGGGPSALGQDPGEPADEIDELNRIKNAETAAEFLQKLAEELNLRPPSPPSSTPPATLLPEPKMPPDTASATLLLTVRTREDALEAVAAASGTERIKIRISPDIPLGAALEIGSILSDVQSDVIEDAGILASKLSQATWLVSQINNAQNQLEHFQMLLYSPWLP